jgi:hypothetical protein
MTLLAFNGRENDTAIDGERLLTEQVKASTMAGGSAEEPRRISPLPELVVEQLSDLWCEALLASLRRDPPVKRRLVLVADKDAA